MKKFFTLVLSLFAFGAVALAQDVSQDYVFTDMQGNVVADGTVLTVKAINDAGQMKVPLMVKNVADGKVAASLYEVIDDLPGGTWQTCAFGNCMTLSKSGYSPKTVTESGYSSDIQTEWIPQEGQYASWTATLQIHIFGMESKTIFGRVIESATDEVIGYGPKVTVRFVYDAQSAGIADVATSTPSTRQFFNLRGQRIDGPRKGLNVVRQDNGKTVIRFYK